MRVEVDVDLKRLELLGILGDSLFGCPDGRLHSLVRINVKSVQILAKSV